MTSASDEVPELSTPSCTGYFEHQDPTNGQPVTKPLSDMIQVLDWVPDRGSAASVPLRKTKPLDGRPRTLVCHDMAGGYLEDRFIQGVHMDDCYRFYNWSCIDVFVYFSHHFVTIPTPWWTNAAHRNGVKVLGTIITEWDDGKKNCDQFLVTEAKRHEFVRKLVDIALFYGFDGWLINIENEIPLDDVTNLVHFVRELTEAMHLSLSGSLVIWYDSVIMSGVLQWQNELNMLNREYFDACDGIFLNYTWKEENLRRSAESAGSRLLDVYVGIDVFGRGCKGDGGFNTIEALTDARNYGLSAAIFAPGWVYEKLGKQDFAENERHFWKLLTPKCDVHALSTFPITTTFCQGWGMRFHVDGEVVGKRPWTNMSVQSVQPVGPQEGVLFDVTKAFHGGGSLQITLDQSRKYIKLFRTNINLCSDASYIISYTVLGISSSAVDLKLDCSSPTTNEGIVELVISDDSSVCVPDDHQQGHLVNVCPLPGFDDQTIGNEQAHLVEPYPWVTRWFSLKPALNLCVQSMSLILKTDEQQKRTVYLGGVRFLEDNDNMFHTVSNLRACDIKTNKVLEGGVKYHEVNLSLCWDFNETSLDHFLVYVSNGTSWTLLAPTVLQTYHVCKWKTVDTVSYFKVQTVTNGGMSVNFEKAPVTSVVLESTKQ